MDWLRRASLLVVLLLVITHPTSGRTFTNTKEQSALSSTAERRPLQLCSRGASCNAQVDFWRAVIDMDLDALENAHDRGADVNWKMNNHLVALHLAAARGDERMGSLLISWGADLEAATVGGTTPLHIAAASGFQKFVSLLLFHHASVHSLDKQGCTPLHLAASGETYMEATISALKAQDQAFSQSGQSWDVRRSFPWERKIIRPNHYAVVRLLLQHGADVNPTARNGRTALHYVSNSDSYTICQLLIQNGASVSVRDSGGRTPLHRAAACGAFGVAEVLLKHGANSYTKDYSGATPKDIICQCLKGNCECGVKMCEIPSDTQFLEALIDEARMEQG